MVQLIDLLAGLLGSILGLIGSLVGWIVQAIGLGGFLAANPTVRFALLSVSKTTIFVVTVAFAMGVPACVYFERKIAAYMQDRLGPNRVGPAGIFQPFADAFKLFLKEDVIPGHVDAVLYCVAPALALIPVIMSFAVIPFGPGLAVPHGVISPAATSGSGPLLSIPMVLADLDMGLVYVFAVSSLTVYGIALGAWASNSKYAIFGGVRAAAQMISYEIAMGLSVVGIFMMASSLSLTEIVNQQVYGTWNIFTQPIGFLIFLVSYFAETNRLPFDLAECEQELVAGFHIEYSSMKFSMYFMAEYAGMLVASALITCLFLGGYDLPLVNLKELSVAAMTAGLAGKASLIGLLGFAVFSVKIAAVTFFFMIIRWTLPRFRYDQLMALGWKIFLPLGLLNIVVTGFVKLFFFN
jgi:NADH-quinone oxidoreductase subunit H